MGKWREWKGRRGREEERERTPLQILDPPLGEHLVMLAG